MRAVLFVALFLRVQARNLKSKCSSLPDQVCTPEGVSIECAHSACADLVPGSCFDITELAQSLVPNSTCYDRKYRFLIIVCAVKACYGERYPELMDATLLWNERAMRGIPAIAAAEGVGTLESMHMQMDVRVSKWLKLDSLLICVSDCLDVRSLGHH